MSRTLAAAIAAGLLLAAGCGADTSRTTGSPTPVVDATSPSATGSPGARPDGRDRARTRVRADRRTLPSRPPAPAPTVPMRQLGRATPWLAPTDLGRGWAVVRGGPENGRLVSDCQRTPLVAIGALESRIREFARDRASARQAVSTFADRRSAWRAQRVVEAWQEDCAEELAGRGAALGAVRHRARLSVVEVDGSARARRRLERLLATVSEGFGRA